MKFEKLLIFVIIALVLLSGCTEKNTDQIQPEKTTNEKQSTPSTAQKPEPGSVQTVHFSKLIEFLPAVPTDWTANEPQGFMYTVESSSWSQATREYAKGDNIDANVGIMDSAYYDVGWFSAWEGIYNFESNEGYAKTTTIKGYPSFEIYTKSSNEYVLYVNVKDRFMIYMTVRGADKDTLNNFANSINYDAISALK